MLREVVQQKLDTLPVQPGVYLFKDVRGRVIYVGKARSLRSRVRSYFQASSSDTRYFIATLASEIGDLETYITPSEKEAALLENHLIKEHKPRHNVKLRDDKEFLSVRLDPKAEWPRLEVVRKPRQDHSLYFGPYPSASQARQTLRLVNRHFQLRTCTDTEFASRKRPCLQYQIKRCPGPCVMEVDRALYGRHVSDVARFLGGKHDELAEDLRARMRDAAAAMNYEQAATYRDQLQAVDSVREKQAVASAKDVDEDAIGFYREAEQAEMAVLQVRRGRLVGVTTFALDDVRLPDAELVASFLASYYRDASTLPSSLLLPVEIDAQEGFAEMIEEVHGRRLEIVVPQRGMRVRLVEMATENAAHAYKEKARSKADADERLAQVQERLRLPKLPRRIECADISHTGGNDTVAAIVAMKDGEPDRARYRSFHIRNVSGGDDYGAMYEALSRRFRRGRDGEAGWELPDLFVVDGGKGQLNVALTAVRDLGITNLSVVGLAKEKENLAGDKLVDRVYVPGQKNAIALREGSAALYVLAHARDEAHRVSNALRTKLGKRRQLRSGLEDIRGIGPKTRKLLLKELGSLRAIKSSDLDALVAAGASRAQAEAIRRHFGENEPERELAESDAVESAFDELDPLDELDDGFVSADEVNDERRADGLSPLEAESAAHSGDQGVADGET
jgi:excinuclease ABC subunit C